MKTIFDKIYVINLVENIERKKFIEQEFKYYKLDFEFIHTIDLYNLFDENTFNFKDPWDNKINIRAVSCALGNYMAVKQAYEFGCNNVLIIEDDVCFTKDKKLLNYYLNNVPEDADLIRYAFRCITEDDLKLIEDISKDPDNSYKDYLLVGRDVPDDVIQYCGTSMWALMNRQTMKKYLYSIYNKFVCSDQIDLFFTNMQNADFNIYLSNRCLNVEFSYFCYTEDNEKIPPFYKNPFMWNLNKNNFYNPKIVKYADEAFTIM